MEDNTTTVIYKHRLDRTPTLEDRANKIGLDGFLEKLREHGWTDEEHNALKHFKLEYKGHAEERNNYIEWKAVLRD